MSAPARLTYHAWTCAAFGAALIGAQWLMPDTAVSLAALCLAVILGMPHGALDLPRARRWLGVQHRPRLAGFLGLYLAAAAGCLGLWAWQPALALAAFLLYSMWHFSEDWCFDAPAARWIGGLSIVGAPALIHRERVETLLAQLTGSTLAETITLVAAAAGALALMALALRVCRCRDRAGAELCLLWLLALALAPLAFFAVYYGALHSLRQSDLALRELGSERWFALREALLTAAAVSVVGAAAAALGVFVEKVTPSDALLRSIFIGLAALTVPHMLLDRLLRRQVRR